MSATPTLAPPSPSTIHVVPAVLGQLFQSSSYYGSTPSYLVIHVLSSDEHQLYGPYFHLNTLSNKTYQLTDEFSPHSSVTQVGFGGFGSSSFGQSYSYLLANPPLFPAPVPVLRCGIHFVSTIEAHPYIPSLTVSSPGVESSFSSFLVLFSQDADDVLISLSDSKNTNMTGFGDSIHTVLESSLLSSFARLTPSTLSVLISMMNPLGNIEIGHAFLHSQSSDNYSVRSLEDVSTHHFHFQGDKIY
ncbi:hypothetical protein B9Z19DRAFT_1067726 [Tuber borchii]|uniref:Uncharacterized protein n=1 Tax=Tuber borchii TaxID=42251 RepID=A0A2T6ZHV3_TUBBO|nr:hypothetical protein B9Z19DRAFT_1067726 [Tuber borchii]